MDSKDIKLALAIPHTMGYCLSDFTRSFALLTTPPVSTMHLWPQTSGPIDAVRNELVRRAQGYEITHLLFMDSDQVYPQDTIIKLLEHDLDIVAAKVHRRKAPYDPILLRGEIDNFKQVPEEEWKDGGLVEVDATGFGCVMLKMSVFNKIEPPWFEFDIYNFKTPVGEDINFWKKAKAAGFKIFTDCSIKINHLNMYVVNEETYFVYKYNTAWDKEAKAS